MPPPSENARPLANALELGAVILLEEDGIVVGDEDFAGGGSNKDSADGNLLVGGRLAASASASRMKVSSASAVASGRTGRARGRRGGARLGRASAPRARRGRRHRERRAGKQSRAKHRVGIHARATCMRLTVRYEAKLRVSTRVVGQNRGRGPMKHTDRRTRRPRSFRRVSRIAPRVPAARTRRHLRASMNGVLVLSTRSGACLFARAFREDLACPADGTRTATARASAPPVDPGAMQLAGLILRSISTRASSRATARPRPRPRRRRARRRPDLRRGCRRPPGTRPMGRGRLRAALPQGRATGDGGRLRRRLVRRRHPGALADAPSRFRRKTCRASRGLVVRPRRQVRAGDPRRADVPAAIAEKIRREAGFVWGCTLRSRADSPPKPTRIASGTKTRDPTTKTGTKKDGTGRTGIRRMPVTGDASTVPGWKTRRGRRAEWRAFAEDGEGNACRAATAARRFVSVAPPPGECGSPARRRGRRPVRAPGTHRRTASVSTTGVRSSGVHETLSDAALEGLAATIHAAAEAMAHAPGTGNARGLRTLECTVEGAARVPMQRVPTRMPMQRVSMRVPLRTTDLFACSRSCGTVSRWRSPRKPSGRVD